DSLGLQIGNHPHAPESFIVPAKGRIRGGILGVIEVSPILQPPDHKLDQRLPILSFRLHSPPQQTFQLGRRSHTPSQRAYSVLIQLVFGFGLARTWEGHMATLISLPL